MLQNYVWRDVFFALRLWRRNPGSTLAAIFALTIGIAGTTATFGIVNALLFRPLPVKDPATLVNIFTTDNHHDASQISMPAAVDMKSRLHSLSAVAIYSRQLFNVSHPAGTVLAHVLISDPALFTVLGIQPAQGNAFTSADSQPGHAVKVVLSWKFWQSQFSGRPVIGQSLRMNDSVYVISGILPKNLDLPFSVDLWTPLEFDLTRPENGRSIHRYYALARLRPAVTLPQLSAELAVFSAQLAAEHSVENEGVSFHAISLRDAIAGDTKIPLFLLLSAVAGVLLMACTNVANLLLGRSSARLREMSVRMAVGAGNRHLFWQSMTESLLLAGVSAAAGLAVAAFALRLIKALPDTRIPRPESLAIDWRVLLFAIAASLLASVLFGLLPALRLSRAPLADVLKQTSGRLTDSIQSQWMRRFLLSAETAIATLLLIAAILLVQSFQSVVHLNLGFQTDHLLTLYVSLPDSRYGSDSIYAARFADQALTIIQAIPGVRSAAFTKNLPVNEGGNGPIQVEGRPAPSHIWGASFVMLEQITPGFRRTLNIPLVLGRDFDAREDMPATRGVLINQALARQYFPGQNPIGKRVSYKLNPNKPDADPDWHQIVGVIADTRRGFDSQPVAALYIPLYRAAGPYPALVVRTVGDPAQYAKSIENAIHKVDPGVPCFLVNSMDDVIHQQLGWRVFTTSLLGIFTGVALVLATVGIFSVVSYSVSQRTSEIGLRMAFGASQRNILAMTLKQGMLPAAVGIVVGAFAALLLGHLLEIQLDGVSLRDPMPYLLAPAFLLLIAAGAGVLPAWRAAAINPSIALRYE